MERGVRRRGRRGFTLMEILVVIIIIAVLAAVAGPMISSMTDKGRKSATKSQMKNIKSAIIALSSDIGIYPGRSTVVYTDTNGNILAADDSNNVLASPTYIKSERRKLWKGPYMDGSAQDFMMDGWGETICIIVDNWALATKMWLASKGADGDWTELNGKVTQKGTTNLYTTSDPNSIDAIVGNDDADDIVISVYRF